MADARAHDVYDVIRERRSIRTYTDEPPPASLLDRLVDVGRWAPTPSNVQSWRFVIVQEPANLSILRNLSPGFPKQATAAVVICSEKGDVDRFAGTSGQVLVAQEVAMAAQNMQLMAHAMGYGSCAVASFSLGGVMAMLELPEHVEPVLILALGIPSRQPPPPARKPLETITHHEVYREAE